MVSNGNAAKLGESGPATLGGVPANEVSGAEESGNVGDRASGRGEADSGRNGPVGEQRVSGTRGVGDDPREVPVSARGTEPEGPAGRGAAAQRGGTQRGDGDAAVRRGRGSRPASGVTAQEKPDSLFTIAPATIGQGGKKAKYRDNVAAIRLLKELEIRQQAGDGRRTGRARQIRRLGRHPGAFARTDGTATSGWAKEIAEMNDILSPEEYQAAVALIKSVALPDDGAFALFEVGQKPRVSR